MVQVRSDTETKPVHRQDINCRFCKILLGEVESQVVYQDQDVFVFLDKRPLFPGHCLVIPRSHYETLLELPQSMIAPMFRVVQVVGQALEEGMMAEGTFIAINNRVSQSISHLHVHVVPRRKHDGLKGFFWPRHPYRDQDHLLKVQQLLRHAMEGILADGDRQP
jgi:histidine triad (HIT) family protein